MSGASLGPVGEAGWALCGVLDFDSVPAVWRQFVPLIQRDTELTVSLAQVERSNSAGLVLLLEARDLARRRHCRLRLLDIPPELLDLARMSRCDRLIGDNPG
jgi:phospholipid transport system transporter-binding protein